MNHIQEQLCALSEEPYRQFNQKLCPDAGREMLGIRIPVLRKLAKEILKKDWQAYLAEEPERYHEEVLLKGLIIGGAKIPLEDKLVLVQQFVPKIDSWQISDTFCPSLKLKTEDLDRVWHFILPYAHSEREFDVRFSLVMMLDYYITPDWAPKVLDVADTIRHEGYYARMALAWMVAELGIKYHEMTMRYLKGENHLDNFTYNKTLQKMRESYRISAAQKAELKQMRRT